MNIEHNMKSLRLLGMERSWKALVETRRMTELNFEDGLQLLLQSELDSREEKRFDRLKTMLPFAIRHRLRSSIWIPNAVWTKPRSLT